MDMSITVACSPLALVSSPLRLDIAALDFDDQQPMLAVGDDEIRFAHRAFAPGEPLDAVEHGERVGQVLEARVQVEFGFAGRVVGAGGAIDLAPVEALQVANRY